MVRRRKVKGPVQAALGVASVLFCLTCTASAYEIADTPIGDLDLTAKFYTQAAWRTEDTVGATRAQTESWDLIQHRNMLQVEAFDKINRYFDAFVALRLVYDGVYDYGSEDYRQPFAHPLAPLNAPSPVPPEDRLLEFDVREAYINYDQGPVFIRLGRQNLSWGETLKYRLLDQINPLDRTWDIFGDLDEQRTPLDMLRAVLRLGTLGFVEDFQLEGFVAEGKEQAPWAQYGTPYSLPAPVYPFNEVDAPEYKDVRGGARILGRLGGHVDVGIGHYWSYPDSPALYWDINWPALGIPLPAGAPGHISGQYNREAITGAQWSWFTGIQATQTVLAGEFAYDWNKQVSDMRTINNVPLPLATLMATGRPEPCAPREIEKFRWSFSADNKIWIRSLNKKSVFNVNLQAIGEHVTDDKDLPADLETMNIEKNYYNFLMSAYTYYMNGDLQPWLVLAYEPTGAWIVNPFVSYRWGDTEFKLSWTRISSGNAKGTGALEDRDQLAFRISYFFK